MTRRGTRSGVSARAICPEALTVVNAGTDRIAQRFTDHHVHQCVEPASGSSPNIPGAHGSPRSPSRPTSGSGPRRAYWQTLSIHGCDVMSADYFPFDNGDVAIVFDHQDAGHRERRTPRTGDLHSLGRTDAQEAADYAHQDRAKGRAPGMAEPGVWKPTTRQGPDLSATPSTHAWKVAARRAGSRGAGAMGRARRAPWTLGQPSAPLPGRRRLEPP